MTQFQSEKAQLVVGSYASYAEAERAVDHLSDQRFPVEHAAIVGRGLSTFEQVTGRLTLWKSAGQSAISGAVLGAVFGWLFGMFNWINPLISGLLLALYGAILGAILGGVFGLLTHAMGGGNRDFSSVSGMRADSYDVLVDAPYAEQAGQLLAGMRR
ncbi:MULTISPECIES: general stress protein [Actinokineospora]|uniref:general stress protein n=1 Tax=Actinokineospora TaxID=39845 RepID=UPI00166FCD32|nr:MULTISPECIES: general stress protein [Actinokineospora]UVS80665.1 putative membrane protein [Actinokineospora sp. UTMC 2448]